MGRFYRKTDLLLAAVEASCDLLDRCSSTMDLPSKKGRDVFFEIRPPDEPIFGKQGRNRFNHSLLDS
jgi:hypothetical protein